MNPRAALEQGTSLEDLVAEVPAESRPSLAMLAALRSAMAPEPEGRFASMDELMEAIVCARQTAATASARSAST